MSSQTRYGTFTLYEGQIGGAMRRTTVKDWVSGSRSPSGAHSDGARGPVTGTPPGYTPRTAPVVASHTDKTTGAVTPGSATTISKGQLTVLSALVAVTSLATALVVSHGVLGLDSTPGGPTTPYLASQPDGPRLSPIPGSPSDSPHPTYRSVPTRLSHTPVTHESTPETPVPTRPPESDQPDPSTSPSPSPDPSTDPSPDPTDDPSEDPSEDPTQDPSENPSPNPPGSEDPSCPPHTPSPSPDQPHWPPLLPPWLLSSLDGAVEALPLSSAQPQASDSEAALEVA